MNRKYNYQTLIEQHCKMETTLNDDLLYLRTLVDRKNAEYETYQKQLLEQGKITKSGNTKQKFKEEEKLKYNEIFQDYKLQFKNTAKKHKITQTELGLLLRRFKI